MSALSRWIDAPKALMPPWLLAAIILLATLAGSLVARGGAPLWAGVVVGAVLSWGGVFAARRALAARGHEGYDELPSADDDSPGAQFVSRMLRTFTPFLVGFAAGGLVLAVGAGAPDDVAGIAGSLVIGLLAAGPSLYEVDARHGALIERRRRREEREIEAHPTPGEAPLRAPRATPRDTSERVEVPVARGKAWGWTALMLAMALGCGGLAAFGTDVSTFERAICAPAAPLFLYVAFVHARIARAPYFLRLDPAGADVLGLGAVPWSAIERADVVSHSSARWLALVVNEPVEGQVWATSGIRRLAKRSKGAEVEGLLRFSAWPAAEVAAELRRRGLEVEAFLA